MELYCPELAEICGHPRLRSSGPHRLSAAALCILRPDLAEIRSITVDPTRAEEGGKRLVKALLAQAEDSRHLCVPVQRSLIFFRAWGLRSRRIRTSDKIHRIATSVRGCTTAMKLARSAVTYRDSQFFLRLPIG